MRLLLLFIIFLTCHLALAQEPVRISINEKDGLPSNEVYAIEEDSKGFIWLATNKGLVRYDGNVFNTYSHKSQRGLSIFEPFVDNQDRLWCMNISGQIFYAKDDRFELFTDLKDDLNGSLASIVVSDNFLIVSMYLKDIIIDLDTKDKTIESRDALSEEEFSKGSGYGFNILYEDEVYQTSKGYLRKMDNGTFENIKNLPSEYHTLEDNPRDIQILHNSNGELFILRQIIKGNIHLIKSHKDGWQEIYIPPEVSSSRIIVAQFLNNRLWLPTENGLFVYSINAGKLQLEAHYLQEFYTTDLFQDGDMNIWVSTLQNGLIVLPNIYVQRMKLSQQFPRRLEKKDDQNLWIGFESGDIIEYNTVSMKHRLIDLPTRSAISTITHDHKSDRTFIFQKVHNYLFDHKSDSFQKIENLISSVKDAAIHKDTLLIANSGAVISTSFVDGNFDKKDNYSFERKKRGYTVFHDTIFGNQYFATIDALYRKNQDSEIIEIKYNDAPILAKNIVQDRNGSIWVATFKNGLYKLDDNKIVERVNSTSGLSSNIINALTIDNDFLWIATDTGLHRYDVSNKEIKTLSELDGIPAFSIIDMVVIGGSLYMNTAQEVFELDIDKVFKPEFIPDYYFTEVNVDGERQPLSTHYEIPDKDTNTSISFNANGLRGLTSGTFQYRLKDHTSWTNVPSGSNSIQFASLPVGNVIFELKQNDSDVIKQLEFDVYQVFYKTSWFWAIVAICAIAGVVLYYRRLLRFRESVKNKELKKLALDNELVSLRLENLRSQMNPHFIFNALNSIQEYIVNNEKNLAASYLVKFSRLIRMYLEQSRENSISLQQELQAMKLYMELEKVRFEDKLEYNINVDPALNLEDVMVPPLFIQPYVENALKHGLLHKTDNRKLSIKFEYDVANMSLVIHVIDNGIGRERAAVIKSERLYHHKSFATYANNERVALLNQKRENHITVDVRDLKYSNGDPAGTEVNIVVPQKHNL